MSSKLSLPRQGPWNFVWVKQVFELFEVELTEFHWSLIAVIFDRSAARVKRWYCCTWEFQLLWDIYTTISTSLLSAIYCVNRSPRNSLVSTWHNGNIESIRLKLVSFETGAVSFESLVWSGSLLSGLARARNDLLMNSSTISRKGGQLCISIHPARLLNTVLSSLANRKAIPLKPQCSNLNTAFDIQQVCSHHGVLKGAPRTDYQPQDLIQ